MPQLVTQIWDILDPDNNVFANLFDGVNRKKEQEYAKTGFKDTIFVILVLHLI